MITGKDKFELLNNFRNIAEQQGYVIRDIKEINYGLQFIITTDNKSGIMRIFEGKKGVRFDISQIRDSELLLKLEQLVSIQPNVVKKTNEENGKKSSLYNFPEEMIGIDESGKGDYFGPLVIAGVYVSKKNASILHEMGVMDSKKLSEKQIALLATNIKKVCPYTVVAIGNKKYNELYYKIKNLNKLLAWGHARVIENMVEKTDCQFALSDQFGDEGLIKKALLEKGKTITLFQRHKAEEMIAVAAASIIARDEFVNRLNQLSTKYKVVLPKGASTKTVQIAKQLVSLHGKQELENVAKLHFKTTEQL
jgi:ribonuclease HIII